MNGSLNPYNVMPGQADERPDGTLVEQVEMDLHEARSELSRAQAELAGCRERSRVSAAALRAIADAVVTVDLQGRIVFLNPVASHLTGWRESEAVGRPVADVLRLSDDHGNRIDVLAPVGTISSLLRRDDHVVFVEGAIAPLLAEGRDNGANDIGAVVTFRNVTAARRLTDELTYHANHDSLTGLDNRRAFEFQLRRAIASAGKHHGCHSLICIDLDRFKAVNDRGGHVAGDELLRQLSALLRAQLREHDTLARLGGDEFAVLLEHCDAGQATVVAEKIRTVLDQFTFQWQGHVFSIGGSLGQVNFDDDTLSPEALLNLADEMCYLAKKRGRNQVVLHALPARSRRRREHADHDRQVGNRSS